MIHGERRESAAVVSFRCGVLSSKKGGITTARMMRKSVRLRNRPNGVPCRIDSNGHACAATTSGRAAIERLLVPPNADRRPRFEMELLENVLDVFLHGARAAPENLADLAVAFAGLDPFHDLELAPGQRRRFGKRAICSANSG